MKQLYYHGSQQADIELLEPRDRTKHKDQTKPRLYASPEIGIAAVMIIPWDDSIAHFGRQGTGPWVLEVLDRNKFKDTAGWIYIIDSEGAIPVEDGKMEVYFEQSKPVLDKIHVPSALKLATEQGIEIRYH